MATLKFTEPGIKSIGKTAQWAAVLAVGVWLATIAIVAAGDDAKDAAIKKDRKQIEGTWRVVGLEVNGNKAGDEDARKITVVNGSDGTWSLRSEGREMVKGISTIDPTQSPKTIDFTPTEGDGKGELHLGIYALGEKTRTLCFAPPEKGRPTQFASLPDSGHILVLFERESAR